ncbi:MarR family winged helix-turn-helix transcriptional regulator [Methylobacterium crusticola]|uniref:MarR family winged helix-turn-helix transcriptional regulator n=1 Tax=Methylobacterium crusticola TaxID=1697972 RepID=UPI000FFBF23C|nr:MarR family transcriptional regulator [Methylobacterium crusticola]
MKRTSSARTPGSPAGLALATFLPYRLSVVTAVVSDGLARLYGARFGIGIPEWRVLATVGEFGAITAKAVGRHAEMGKVKVSRAAAALEARGYIRRRPNAEDLREAFLTLTPEGERVYAEIVPLALDYAERLTADLGPAERAALDGLIAALLRRARAMTAPP